jgi:hypothetical protein
MTAFEFSIGDIVEVFCDHKRGGRRVRDWLEGVVVHADDRMIAVQFRNDVYLTDGWMVPDRILWFKKGTEKIRAAKKTHGHLSSSVTRPFRSSPRGKKKPCARKIKPKKTVKRITRGKRK